MRVVFIIKRVVLFLFISTAVFSQSVEGISTELQNIADTAKHYAVKKHIGLAQSYIIKNRSKSFSEEIEVLKSLDPENSSKYVLILQEYKTINPENKSISVKDHIYSRSENAVMDKFQKAYKYYRESRLDKAKGVFEDILEIDKTNSDAKQFIKEMAEEVYVFDENKPFQKLVRELYDEGMRAYRQEKYSIAESKFLKARDMDLSNKQISKYLGIISEKISDEKLELEIEKLLAKADELRNQGKIGRSRKLYEKVIGMDKNNRRSGFYIREYEKQGVELTNKAYKSYESGLFKESYDEINEALAYFPENKSGNDLKRKLKMLLAEAKIEGRNKKTANRLYNEGVTYYSKGEFDKAITAWKSVLEINPDDADAIANIKRAEDKIESVQKLNIESVKSTLVDAGQLFDQGLMEKARAKYEYVLRIDTENIEAKKGILKIEEMNKSRDEKKVLKR